MEYLADGQYVLDPHGNFVKIEPELTPLEKYLLEEKTNPPPTPPKCRICSGKRKVHFECRKLKLDVRKLSQKLLDYEFRLFTLRNEVEAYI